MTDSLTDNLKSRDASASKKWHSDHWSRLNTIKTRLRDDGSIFYTLIGQMCNPYTRLYAYQTIIIWWVSVHYILCQLRAFSWWCEKGQGIASHPKWNFQNTRKEWLSETLRTLVIRINEPCWDQVQLLCPPGASLSHRRGPATIWWKSEK